MFRCRNKNNSVTRTDPYASWRILTFSAEPQHSLGPSPVSAIPVRTLWKSPLRLLPKISSALERDLPNPHPPRSYLHSLTVADLPKLPSHPSPQLFPPLHQSYGIDPASPSA